MAKKTNTPEDLIPTEAASTNVETVDAVEGTTPDECVTYRNTTGGHLQMTIGGEHYAVDNLGYLRVLAIYEDEVPNIPGLIKL